MSHWQFEVDAQSRVTTSVLRSMPESHFSYERMQDDDGTFATNFSDIAAKHA